MRKRLFAATALLWGCAILLFHFLRKDPPGSSAYEAGRSAGEILGVLLVLVGGYTLFRGSGSRPK